MAIYRGDTPLKAYKGDMQPVNIYKGATKVAGWHPQTVSGTGTISLDGAYNVPPDALVVDGKCVQGSTTGKNLLDIAHGTVVGWNLDNIPISLVAGVTYTFKNGGSTKSVSLWDKTRNINLTGYLPLGATSTFTPTANVTVAIVGYNGAGQAQYAAQHQLQIEAGSTATAYEPYTGGIPSPNPDYPQPITSITGDLTITATNPTESDQVVTPLGTVELCSLPDGTKDTYDAVTGVLTKRTAKAVFDGSADEGWWIGGAAPNIYFARIATPAGEAGATAILNDRFLSGSQPQGCYIVGEALVIKPVIDGVDTSAAWRTWLASNPTTVIYKLETPTTTQLTPNLPVLRHGIKTLSVSANITPDITATVKVMD